MSFFATIHEEVARRKLRFLVIGGLAVIHYGYGRETSDMDLLISKNDREDWLKFWLGRGYVCFHDGGVFIQLKPPDSHSWPVDLMMTPEETFAPIFDAGCSADIYDVKSRVPTLEHLIMLKLHALKHGGVSRFLKDFLDVEYLIRYNKLDIKSTRIRELCKKYGPADIYEKISRSLSEG